MKNKPIQAVVIDNDFNPRLFSALVEHDLTLYRVQEGAVVPCVPEIGEKEITHGTVCAALLAELLPSCKLSGIAIADAQGRLFTENLCAALRWCLENPVDLISMSIGTEDPWDLAPLWDLTQALEKRGCVLVAASSNSGRISYPASLETVLGVRCGRENQTVTVFENPLDGINLAVGLPKSGVLEQLRQRQSIDWERANSLAVPCAAALCGRFLAGEKEPPGRALDYFRKIATVAQENAFVLDRDKFTVPVVGLMGESGAGFPRSFALKLLRRFRAEGYLAVLLDVGGTPDLKNSVFPLREIYLESDLAFYLEKVKSGIFLLSYPPRAADAIAGLGLADLVFSSGTCPWGIEEIFEAVTRHFEEGEDVL